MKQVTLRHSEFLTGVKGNCIINSCLNWHLLQIMKIMGRFVAIAIYIYIYDFNLKRGGDRKLGGFMKRVMRLGDAVRGIRIFLF